MLEYGKSSPPKLRKGVFYMGNRLFMMSSNGVASEVQEQKYEAEDRLQEFIANNPQLIEQSHNGTNCRLYLVKRELTIAESDASTNSYSLDHLFIAEDGVPVLVEIKRSSDTRLRREVVAQMLDYACRAHSWDVKVLRQMFVEANDGNDEALSLDNDSFWSDVSQNLMSEHLRLIFVADEIPDTLVALIAFLNRNMPEIEVYSAEVRQHINNETTIITSRLIIPPKSGSSNSPARSLVKWNAQSFSDTMKANGQAEELEIALKLNKELTSSGFTCEYGRSMNPAFSVYYESRKIFNVSSWQKKPSGNIVTVEISIDTFLNAVGGNLTDEEIRDCLTNFENKNEAFDSGLAWNTPHYLYIRLRALASDDSRAVFIHSLKRLVNHQSIS